MLHYYLQELILYYIGDLNRVCCFYPFFKIAKKMYNPKTIIYDIIEHPTNDPPVDLYDNNNLIISTTVIKVLTHE
jgi:hypothetical protein